jgi:hypothetical protein
MVPQCGIAMHTILRQCGFLPYHTGFVSHCYLGGILRAELSSDPFFIVVLDTRPFSTYCT